MSKSKDSYMRQLAEATKKVNQFISFVISKSKDNEEWKEIKCGNERYFVSSQGRILSLQRSTPLIMTPFNCDGYQYITICIDGQKTNKRVNRLVAEAFLPNPEGKNIVHHKNHNKNDNSIENLAWATAQENRLAYLKYKKENAEKAINDK